MTKSKKTAFQFAKVLEELETIVNTMEAGDLPLEEALKQFEQGVKLSKTCQQALQDADQKVKIITQDHQLQDFNTD